MKDSISGGPMRINETLINYFVGKRTNELMVRKGLTQEDSAMPVNVSRPAVANCESNKYPIDKLTAIYRLCAALEVELTDVLPRIIVISDKSSPDVVISQDEKLPDKFKEELREYIDDIKEGS